MSIFQAGTVVRLSSEQLTILGCVGDGSQAEVYLAQDAGGNPVALKYFFGNYCDKKQKSKFYDKLKLLSGFSSPHPALVWPRNVSRFDPKTQTFFYTMAPLGKEWKSLAQAINSENLLSQRQKLELSAAYVDIFRSLHDRKLIYGDISATNLRFRTVRGKVQAAVIDCDNVTLEGHTLGLQGTGLYRAPEILCGKSLTRESDRYALASILFQLLVGCNPLDGAAARSEPFSNETVLKYWCRQPLFIFDANPSNRCIFPQAQRRWAALPEGIRLYFQVMFSQSRLLCPEQRPDLSVLDRAIKLALLKL